MAIGLSLGDLGLQLLDVLKSLGVVARGDGVKEVGGGLGNVDDVLLAGTLDTNVLLDELAEVAVSLGSGEVRSNGLSILDDLTEVGGARLDLAEDVFGGSGD